MKTTSQTSLRFKIPDMNPTCVLDTASQTSFHLISSEEATALNNMLNYLADMALANEDYFPHMYILNPVTVAKLKAMPTFS